MMPRAYIGTSFAVGATSPKARAIAAQRAAETTLDAIPRTSARTKTGGSTRPSACASRDGPTIQSIAASRSAPATVRTATRRARLPASASAGLPRAGQRTRRAARLVLPATFGLVVDARQQFAEYAGRDELHADQQEQRAEQQQRASADRVA